jgi:hypothetical protein
MSQWKLNFNMSFRGNKPYSNPSVSAGKEEEDKGDMEGPTVSTREQHRGAMAIVHTLDPENPGCHTTMAEM